MSTLAGLTWKPLALAIPLYLLSDQISYVDAKKMLLDMIAKTGLSTSITKTFLKILLGLSLVSTINNYLNQRSSGRGLLGTRDTYDWSREIVVVTGSSSGIGHLVVKELAKRGVKTMVLDMNPPKAAIKNAFFYKVDVTSDSEIAEVCNRIRKEHGNPTVLVNNAGIGTPSFILETSMSYVRKVFEVNTIAHYALVKQFLPSMLRNNHGHIINIASMASFVTLGKNVPYSGSKAAALAMTDGMRQEAHNFYKAKKVLFSSVHPHFVNTPMVAPYFTDMSDFLDPQDVAMSIVNLIYGGYSKQLILPKMAGMWAGIQGYPNWLGTAFRSSMSLKYLPCGPEAKEVVVKAD